VLVLEVEVVVVLVVDVEVVVVELDDVVVVVDSQIRVTHEFEQQSPFTTQAPPFATHVVVVVVEDVVVVVVLDVLVEVLVVELVDVDEVDDEVVLDVEVELLVEVDEELDVEVVLLLVEVVVVLVVDVEVVVVELLDVDVVVDTQVHRQSAVPKTQMTRRRTRGILTPGRQFSLRETSCQLIPSYLRTITSSAVLIKLLFNMRVPPSAMVTLLSRKMIVSV